MFWTDTDKDVTGWAENDCGVSDTSIICDLFWTDTDKDVTGWAENDCSVSFIPRQVVEDGYEFLAMQLLITVFSAPGHYGEFDDAGVTNTLVDCTFAEVNNTKVSVPDTQLANSMAYVA